MFRLCLATTQLDCCICWKLNMKKTNYLFIKSSTSIAFVVNSVPSHWPRIAPGCLFSWSEQRTNWALYNWFTSLIPSAMPLFQVTLNCKVSLLPFVISFKINEKRKLIILWNHLSAKSPWNYIVSKTLFSWNVYYLFS